MRPRLPRSARLYVATVCTTGAAVLAWLLDHGWGPPSLHASPAFLVLVAAVVVGELRPVNAPVGREGVEVTVSTTFAFALLLLSGPAEAALALAVATLVADSVARKSWWKRLFNVAQYALSTAAAGVAAERLAELHRSDGPQLRTAGSLLVVAAAAAAFFATNAVVTGAALTLVGRVPLGSFLRNDLPYQAVANAALLAMSPVVMVVVSYNVALFPLLLVPFAMAHKSSAVSAQKEYQTLHDALTGLPNRVLFRDRAADAVAAARRQ